MILQNSISYFPFFFLIYSFSYFEQIDRLASDDYVPSEQDVLRSRAKTTGIIETEFQIEKTRFKYLFFKKTMKITMM